MKRSFLGAQNNQNRNAGRQKNSELILASKYTSLDMSHQKLHQFKMFSTPLQEKKTNKSHSDCDHILQTVVVNPYHVLWKNDHSTDNINWIENICLFTCFKCPCYIRTWPAVSWNVIICWDDLFNLLFQEVLTSILKAGAVKMSTFTGSTCTATFW